MSLKDQITEDMKTAMRAKDSERLGTIRLLLAALKQKEVDERVVLDDAAVVAIVDKLIKQRKDSLEAVQKAERRDLADKEAAELAVLQAYLPARLSAEHLAAALAKVREPLGECLRKDPAHPLSARLTVVVDSDSHVLTAQALPASLTPCVEPILRKLTLPATTYGKRDTLHHTINR